MKNTYFHIVLCFVIVFSMVAGFSFPVFAHAMNSDHCVPMSMAEGHSGKHREMSGMDDCHNSDAVPSDGIFCICSIDAEDNNAEATFSAPKVASLQPLSHAHPIQNKINKAENSDFIPSHSFSPPPIYLLIQSFRN